MGAALSESVFREARKHKASSSSSFDAFDCRDMHLQSLRGDMSLRSLREATFFAEVTKNPADPKFLPRYRKEVAEKFQVPYAPKKETFIPQNEDRLEEEYSAILMEVQSKMAAYQENFNAEMLSFVHGEESAIYLVFQPIWNCKSSTLVGMEVLCRVENGKDDAPMPALANFQADPGQCSVREDFTRKQLDFAADACKQFPTVWVSVNVRPDQLDALKNDLIAKASDTTTPIGSSNLVIEVTEYAPIDQRVLSLIEEMRQAGVVFALDDVNEVRDQPVPRCMAGRNHACSFEISKENASLFSVQKLATQMSCSVFRKEVFPTPQYAGGKAVPYLQTMILPEEDTDGIKERNKLVETWVNEVSIKNPQTQFVIECSVYAEDLQRGRSDLYPALQLFESDKFHIQGGRTGGRGFQLEVFAQARAACEGQQRSLDVSQHLHMQPSCAAALALLYLLACLKLPMASKTQISSEVAMAFTGLQRLLRLFVGLVVVWKNITFFTCLKAILSRPAAETKLQLRRKAAMDTAVRFRHLIGFCAGVVLFASMLTTM